MNYDRKVALTMEAYSNLANRVRKDCGGVLYTTRVNGWLTQRGYSSKEDYVEYYIEYYD